MRATTVLLLLLLPMSMQAGEAPDADSWIAAGYTAEVAERWKKRGFEPAEALRWGALVNSYPHEDTNGAEEALNWVRWGFTLEQAEEYMLLGGSARAARTQTLYEGLTPEQILVYRRAAMGVSAPREEPRVKVLPLPGAEPVAEASAELPDLPAAVGRYAEDCAPLRLEAQFDLAELGRLRSQADEAGAQTAEAVYRGRVAAYRRCLAID